MIPRFRGCGPGGRNASLFITTASNSRMTSIKDMNELKDGKNIYDENQ